MRPLTWKVSPQSPPQPLRGLGRRTRALRTAIRGLRSLPKFSLACCQVPDAHLQSNVLGLVSHGHPGNAGQINEGQVRDLRGGDLQRDELVTNANSNPGYGVLRYGGQDRRSPESALAARLRKSSCS